MEGKVRIAAVQLQCRIGDAEGNVQKACDMIDEIAEAGADIICLPELFNVGCFCTTLNQDYFDLAEPIPGPTTEKMAVKARERQAYLIVPLFEKKRPGYYFNSAAFIDPEGEVIGTFRKVHLPHHENWRGKFYFRPGYNFPVFETPYGNIGIMICYDRAFPETARILTLKGADIIFCPAAVPTFIEHSWEFILCARASENQVFVVGSGMTGLAGEDLFETNGRSLVIDPLGKIISRLGREEAVITATIDLKEIDRARRTNFNHRNRRPEVYHELIDLNRD